MQVIGSISYTKVKEIGIGQGMNSKVYLADDPQLGGRVAAKEIAKANFANRAQYFEEAQAMFAVAHDHVVAVQYACETPTTVSLVMPYFKNGSLADRIQDRPLRLSEVLTVTYGVLAGLAHIHLAGFIHFDIKPSNVLFSNTGRPMVADFGQSRTISKNGVVTVPPLYWVSQPPETVATGAATQLADIYHVGLLMYRALNGNAHFLDQVPTTPTLLRPTIAKGKFPDRNKFMPHVPARIRTLVRKALRVDPTERFQSAVEMADTLSGVDLALDWSVEPLLVNGFRWRASRPGQCDFVVELTEQGGTWVVETFTEKAGQPRRAKSEPENWRRFSSRDDAFAHLKEVFERLLQ
jgi:serine/threonine protein kinase